MQYAPNVRRAQGTTKSRPAMKKISTVQKFSTEQISLTKECEWKDGDRGGLVEWK
jgi:hypothetical protein